MHEKTVESLILRHHAEIWPKWGLTLRSTQVPLDAGRRDMLFAGVDRMWVMKLKRDVVTASTIDQLQRYVLELRRRYPETTYSGIAVAPSVSSAGALREEVPGTRHLPDPVTAGCPRAPARAYRRSLPHGTRG